MSKNKNSEKYSKNRITSNEWHQKWLDRENFQDLAKIGGDI